MAGSHDDFGGYGVGLLSRVDIERQLRLSSDPFATIDFIQAKHAPRLEECEPVIGFLEDMLHVQRFDLYRDLCENLKERVSLVFWPMLDLMSNFWD